MPHEHPICDSDKHFIIDPITRNITNQSSKITIMQYDHNSERFTFEIPKFIECHDMSLCDAVRIHFINIGSIKTDTASGVYEVDDVAVSLDNPDAITFSWLIKGSSTKYNGSLNFAIRFYCFSDENVIDYSWGTNIYSGIKVSNGLENSDMIVEDYVDVLEKWKQEVIDICIQPATKTNLGCVKVGANLSITEDGTLSADAKEIEIDNETIVKTEDGKLKANISTKTSELENDSGFVAASELAAGLADKQDIISDLATIRSGAAMGATALQSVPSSYRTAEAQDVIDSGKQDKLIAGENITIAEDGKTISATGGSSVPKPLTYDYMPEGYPSKSVQTTVLMEEQECVFTDDAKSAKYYLTDPLDLVGGQTYTVNWDGTEYECVCGNKSGVLFVGNLLYANMGEDSGEPFLYDTYDNAFTTFDASLSHTISVKTIQEVVTPMDEILIPDTIQRVEGDVILPSSTADSTKTFKLTVDDSGVPSLTNTEDSTEVWTPSDSGSGLEPPTKTGSLLRGDTDNAKWSEVNADGGYGWKDAKEINFTSDMYDAAEKVTYTETDSGGNETEVTAFVKISDDVITMEEAESVCTLTFIADGEPVVYDFMQAPYNKIQQVGTTGISLYYGHIFSCSQAEDAKDLFGVETPVMVPAGTWLLNELALEASYYPFKVSHGIKHIIDKSYLPDSEPVRYIYSAEFSKLASNLRSGKTVIFTDYYLTQGGRIINFGGDMETYITLTYDSSPSAKYKYVPDDLGNIYFDHHTSVEATNAELYLKSSTADSTKTFKITVDDSGTISATEVT